MPPDQSRIIEQAKFAYSTLGNALVKQRKQLNIKQENKLAALTNNDDKNSFHKEIFGKLVRESYDGVWKLTSEINPGDLM